MSTSPNPRRPPDLPGGLYALVDDTVLPEVPLWEKAARVLDGGVKVLQVRMKRTLPREALAACRAIVERCRAQGAVCVLDDRVDYALLSHAHGVHLGDTDLPPEEARELLGPTAVIGVTVRDLEGARRARACGASYVGLGPIFSTSTKQVAHPLLGLEGLRAVTAHSPLPVVAIAGITLANIAQVAEAGAHGAAVASDLLCAKDPAVRAGELTASFEVGRARRSIAASP